MDQVSETAKLQKPELIVGIVGRLGTNLLPVIDAIKGECAKYGYRTIDIHVTKLLSRLAHKYTIVEAPLDQRIASYISACNKLRQDTKRKDIFALLASNLILSNRKNVQDSEDLGTVYIVNQLKKPEEIYTLKRIYGEAFVVVSCHSPYEVRLSKLSEKFATEHGEPTERDKWKRTAEALILQDEKEVDSFGQNVSAAFPLADCIVDAPKEGRGVSGIGRLFRLIFGDPHLSPTYEEYGSNIAAQAALRSTDLSRQVGAAIFDHKRTIVSMGSNEVPKYSGGTYWTDHENDGRDAHRGYDENTIKKRDLVIDVVERLQAKSILKKEWDTKSHEELTKALLDEEGAPLTHSDILNISEYGRALHAEMNAITDAARGNSTTQGATLFVTTFPCHNCAKHIVGSGISKVYFLEPYPKSEALNLYSDSIAVDSAAPTDNKVLFEQFCGVTSQLFHLFSKSRLKDEKGILKDWRMSEAICLLKHHPHHFEHYEVFEVSELEPALVVAGIGFAPDT